jgi:drug/metabolite transporter (DMT)-like permease
MLKKILAAPPDTLPAASDPRARLIGIGLICAALVCFAFLDTTAKWLNSHLNTLEVVWSRYAFHFLLSLLFINPWTIPGLFRTKRPGLQFIRSCLLFASTVFNFFALKYLQLDQASVIAFMTPFIIAIFAGPLLGEWIGWRRWVAIIVGFLGVIVIARPGAGGIHPAAILSIMSCIAYALYNITTRMLASEDSTATTLFYSSLVGFVVASVPLPFVWTTPGDPWIISGMVAVGAFGLIGHMLLIIAHRYAPAAVLAPFIYTQIIWYVAGGFLAFGDVPNAYTIAGAAIIISSGLYLLYRERTKKADAALKAQTGE